MIVGDSVGIKKESSRCSCISTFGDYNFTKAKIMWQSSDSVLGLLAWTLLANA